MQKNRPNIIFHNMPNISGTILGIQFDTKKEEVIRGIFVK